MPRANDPAADITVTPWPQTPATRIGVARGKPPAASRAAEALWRKMCAANPRLHDGPILAVNSVDLASARIECRRESYKRFVTARVVGEPIEAMGVTGIIIRARAGRDEVLIGKRSANVRIYGGLWETAPRGTIEPPRRSGSITLSVQELYEPLHREADEELRNLGIVLPMNLACIVRDPVASSLDLCYSCVWCERYDKTSDRSWEYDQLRWVPTRTLLRRKHLSPPTRALWRPSEK